MLRRHSLHETIGKVLTESGSSGSNFIKAYSTLESSSPLRAQAESDKEGIGQTCGLRPGRVKTQPGVHLKLVEKAATNAACGLTIEKHKGNETTLRLQPHGAKPRPTSNTTNDKHVHVCRNPVEYISSICAGGKYPGSRGRYTYRAQNTRRRTCQKHIKAT